MTTRNIPAAIDFPAATILGYPRIGPGRELKRALEAYWSDPETHPAATVLETLAGLRRRTVRRLT